MKNFALKKRPWQRRGYAIGLAESIEMTIADGHQSLSMIAVSIRAEWGSPYSPTNREVQLERAKLRKTGHLSYSRKNGWQLATPKAAK